MAGVLAAAAAAPVAVAAAAVMGHIPALLEFKTPKPVADSCSEHSVWSGSKVWGDLVVGGKWVAGWGGGVPGGGGAPPNQPPIFFAPHQIAPNLAP